MTFQSYIKKGHFVFSQSLENGKLHYEGSANALIKSEINGSFAERSRQLYDKCKDHFILVLDGPELYSSSMLVKNHIPSDRIFVPNCTKTDFKKAAMKLASSKHPVCTLFPLSAYELLHSCIGKKKFCSIWLDFCGSFWGSAKHSPPSDLDLIFTNQLLSKYALIGVTFHLKDRCLGKHRPKMSTRDIIHFVHTLAATHGYKLKLIRHEEYHGMCTLFWDVVRAQMKPQKEYQVERIVSQRDIDGILHYEVKWKHYDSKFNTFEPIEHLKHCHTLIESFKSSRKRRRGSKN